MPPTSVVTDNYAIGICEVYYRDVGVLTPWTSVGITMDDVIARIQQEVGNASESLNGVDGFLRGLDYRKNGPAEFEFTLPELSGSKLALAIPGVLVTPGVTTDSSSSPLDTTLAADALIGATNIRVTAITNAAVGDYVRINVAGVLAEYRQLTFVGTAGAGGTGLSFRDPLLKSHLSGVVVKETLGDGRTSITPTSIRRQPPTAYKDWALVSQSPASYAEILIYRAIPFVDAVELTFSDDITKPAGFKTIISSRKDETDLTKPSWEIKAAA